MLPRGPPLAVPQPLVIAVESRLERTRLCAVLGRYGCDCRPLVDADSLVEVVQSLAGSVVVIDSEFGGQSASRWRIGNRPLFEVASTVVRAELSIKGLLSAVRLLRQGAAGVITSVEDHEELQSVVDLARYESISPREDSDRAQETGKLTPLQRHERQLIIDALRQTKGHVSQAARLLQLGQATVYRKIQKYDIPRPRRTMNRA